MTEQKLDLFRAHKDEYVTPKKPQLVQTKPARYLTILGSGEPGGETFQAAVGALYGTAYTLKFSMKAAGKDYKVAPLEGLWWGGEGESGLPETPSDWKWKLIIRTPDFVQPSDLEQAVDAMLAKGKDPLARQVQLETIDEGLVVQMLHVGSYASEPQSITAMQQFAAEQGYSFHGRHHEIYLSDPNRVPPERLRTILRFPVR
jgi:hypothetical protein